MRIALKTLANTILIASFFPVWFECTAQAGPATEKKSAFSPDKKWEYRVIQQGDTLAGALFKAGSNKPVATVLDLEGYNSDAANSVAESGELVWAPDSRHFAFNFQPDSGRVTAFDLYELAGEKWTKLPDEEELDVVQQAGVRLIKNRVNKLQVERRGPIGAGSHYLVKRWIDQDTFEGSATEGFIGDHVFLGWSLTFKGRCDNRGDWKVISVSNAKVTDSE